MYPDQPSGQQQNPYDFIVNPGQAPKKTILPKLGGSSFAKKIVFIVGGAFVLIILIWTIASLFGGSSINRTDIVALAQTQEEIARVAQKGEAATDQSVKNGAASTKLTMETQQKEWLAFLADQGIEVEAEELALKKNDAADKKLEDAKASNTYDLAFEQVMETYLTEYLAQLEADFDKATSDTQKELLQSQYDQTKLLLEQLPKN